MGFCLLLCTLHIASLFHLLGYAVISRTCETNKKKMIVLSVRTWTLMNIAENIFLIPAPIIEKSFAYEGYFIANVYYAQTNIFIVQRTLVKVYGVKQYSCWPPDSAWPWFKKGMNIKKFVLLLLMNIFKYCVLSCIECNRYFAARILPVTALSPANKYLFSYATYFL